jgi:hypothetical protein
MELAVPCAMTALAVIASSKRAIRQDGAEMSAQGDAATAGPDALAQVEDVLRRLEAIDPADACEP